mgnify:FL=1
MFSTENTMNSSNRKLLLVSSIALSLAATSGVQAQDDDDAPLEEVLVTATKRSQTIQDLSLIHI